MIIELVLDTHEGICGFCHYEGDADTKSSDIGRGCAA